MFLFGVDLTVRLMNPRNCLKLILTDVVPHGWLHAVHITVKLADGPVLLMPVLFEQFPDQPFWLVPLIHEWQHLVHYVRDYVPILISPLRVKTKLRLWFPPLAYYLLFLSLSQIQILLFLIFWFFPPQIYQLFTLRFLTLNWCNCFTGLSVCLCWQLNTLNSHKLILIL